MKRGGGGVWGVGLLATLVLGEELKERCDWRGVNAVGTGVNILKGTRGGSRPEREANAALSSPNETAAGAASCVYLNHSYFGPYW
ncbi:hypothetical protein L6164_027560 [Bauhinia variegata]|uniref:Uncharacterized protein n=1 Tax=Bauhinia variegata TaxID=167791 RepID=A0ACB9LTB0_BAUVA|nr:hypothetical protein L6164_027560 [Bauhinia variegata]